MVQIAAAHRRFGTLRFLPTIITNRANGLARAVDAAIEAQGRPGILGLPIAGPPISQARRGTHARNTPAGPACR